MTSKRPEPIVVHPFPNMPTFTAEQYQGEVAGCVFYSMCSQHIEHDDECVACQAGSYKEKA